MRHLGVLALLVASGCTQLLGLEPPLSDEPVLCVGTGLFTHCWNAATIPSSPLSVPAGQTLDTDTSPLCEVAAQSTGQEVCVVGATEISVMGQLCAVGARPLVLAATTEITVLAQAAIDVASSGSEVGAGAVDCGSKLDGGFGFQGGGGGAGGGFGTAGGDGGDGDEGGAGGMSNGQVPLEHVRGGCAGGRGGAATLGLGAAGGAGGGVAYLIAAERIAVHGRINASGGGGKGAGGQGGGGGGGSGGLIGFDAPVVSLEVGSTVFANGGGGGGGGIPGKPSGKDGAVSSAPSEPALGGSGSLGEGNGGAGATSAVGEVGGSNSDGGGGGGGGGGVGYIRVWSPAFTSAGEVSPPVS